MTNWIKFADEKPNGSGWYICVYNDRARGVQVEPMWWWDTQEIFEQGEYTPTHWMPLPEPPSE